MVTFGGTGNGMEEVNCNEMWTEGTVWDSLCEMSAPN